MKRKHSKSLEENETKKEIKKRVEINMKRNAKIDREKVMKILGKEQYKDMSIKEMKVREEECLGNEERRTEGKGRAEEFKAIRSAGELTTSEERS